MKVIPTILELYNGIVTDIKNKFGISSTENLKEVLIAIADVQAACMKLYYLGLNDVQKNIFPDLADSELNGGTLERIGRIRLSRDPYPAQQGIYTIDVTGSAGGIIAAGRQYKSGDLSLNPSKLFEVVTTVTLTGSTGQVQVRSLEAGDIAELEVGDPLTLTVPLVNVDANAIVNTIDTAPVEAETLDAYREKILDSYRLSDDSGTASAYRLWAQDVAGVRKIYPFAKDSVSGYVDIYVEAELADSTDGKGTPPSSMVLAIWNPSTQTGVFEYNALTSKGRRPLGIIIDAQAITLKTITITITGLQTDTTEVRTLISDTIAAMLYDVRPFVSASDDPNYRNDKLLRANISTEITLALGRTNTFSDLTMFVDAVELTEYQFVKGNIPTLGTITYA